MDIRSIPFMDLHNHTTWSDGIHNAEKIILNALQHGVEAVGITDHFQTDKCHSVKNKDLKEYIEELNKLKETYKDRIEVFSGIELCMNSKLSDLEHLPYNDLNKLDYVLLEYIDYFKYSVKFTELDNYLNKLSCNVGLAHTDLIKFCKNYGSKFVINTLREKNIFWELNVNEGYKYFDKIVESIDTWTVSRFFKKLKKNNIPMSVGSDTHSLEYYDIEKLSIGNMLCKHRSIKILKYDFSISRAMHYDKNLIHHKV